MQAIYCDAFNTFEVVDDTHFRFRSVPVVLCIMLPLTYPGPAELPKISIDSNGLGISRLEMSHLHTRLEAVLQHKPDQPVLFDLTEETREFTEGLREVIRASLEEGETETEREDYNINEPDKRVTDLAIVQSHMGSTTIETIMSRLPSSTKLLHAEVVLRTDLRERYLTMREKLQQHAVRAIRDRRKRDMVWDKYGQEEIVFHGTLGHNVGSIVRSGFVVPGQETGLGEAVGVRCGSTWGQGIYTSPDPEYSLWYTDYSPDGGVDGRHRLLPGQKLIICVVLMGRRRNVTSPRRFNSNVEEGFDSHVSPNELEYVVFNSVQVLPLYVLHLGDQQAQSVLPKGLDFRQPVDLTEYARKYLPNGFGMARGRRFVVEEIAPVDDDEELWGEYQYTNAEQQSEFLGRLLTTW